MAQTTTREATAYARNVRMSPFKVRRVLDQIRGRSYEEALMILEFMPYRACKPVLKVLKEKKGVAAATKFYKDPYASPQRMVTVSGMTNQEITDQFITNHYG